MSPLPVPPPQAGEGTAWRRTSLHWRNSDLRGIQMTHLVVMEGDGIGPEITAATLGVMRAADAKFGLRLRFTPVPIGVAALKAEGTTLPEASVTAAEKADGVVLGPVDHNSYPP